MIGNKKVLAIIPARGGSKGIPGKNVKELAGKPLIAWTIEEAKKSAYIDRIILSSDDKIIIDVARSYGCDVPFVRPKELALDHTPGIDPVMHAIEQIKGYDYVVLLQPTSPLRNVEDIDNTIEKCHRHNGIACVSVTESGKSPYWMFKVHQDDKMTPFLKINEIPVRRQESPKVFSLNGAVYVSTIDNLMKEKTFMQKDTIAYIMPNERSYDIDKELDFLICECLIAKR